MSKPPVLGHHPLAEAREVLRPLDERADQRELHPRQARLELRHLPIRQGAGAREGPVRLARRRAHGGDQHRDHVRRALSPPGRRELGLADGPIAEGLEEPIEGRPRRAVREILHAVNLAPEEFFARGGIFVDDLRHAGELDARPRALELAHAAHEGLRDVRRSARCGAALGPQARRVEIARAPRRHAERGRLLERAAEPKVGRERSRRAVEHEGPGPIEQREVRLQRGRERVVGEQREVHLVKGPLRPRRLGLERHHFPLEPRLPREELDRRDRKPREETSL